MTLTTFESISPISLITVVGGVDEPGPTPPPDDNTTSGQGDFTTGGGFGSGKKDRFTTGGTIGGEGTFTTGGSF